MDKKALIQEFKKIYGDKYDYSEVKDVINTNDKITIICPIHGKFEKTVNNHLRGQGCKYCKTDERIKRQKENLIKMGNKIHNNKYDYSEVEYINNRTKVCIICPIHGKFWQVPSAHLSGCGCPKCANKNKTLEEVLDVCKKIHGDKYDYSLIESPVLSKKQKIKCNKCGNIFQMTLLNHIYQKQGCKYCSHRSYAYTTEEFIEKARKIHGDKYDYSKVVYVNKKTKICVICPIHGEFWITPDKHINAKQGCPHCTKLSKLTKEIFTERSNKVHNNKYDYSNVEFKTVEDKVCIICPIHGEFWQTPHSHMSGVGCPKCHEEKNINESLLFDIIKEHYGDEVISQYRADWLKGQSIDIYIPSKKVGIEYQGIQHFKPVKYFGGEKKFQYMVKKDKEKYQKCKNKGIKLFYFSKEKELPEIYLDYIYSNNNDLINEINNYGT